MEENKHSLLVEVLSLQCSSSVADCACTGHLPGLTVSICVSVNQFFADRMYVCNKIKHERQKESTMETESDQEIQDIKFEVTEKRQMNESDRESGMEGKR